MLNLLSYLSVDDVEAVHADLDLAVLTLQTVVKPAQETDVGVTDDPVFREPVRDGASYSK